MILQELYKLALREKLLDDPAFADRALTFVVRIDETGAYRGLEPMLDERGRGRTVRAPKVPVRSSGIATAFLVDNVQYTLRIAKDGKQDNADKRAAAFDALVASAADETHDAGLVALQRFLARRAEFIDALRADAPTRAAKKGAAETPWEWNGDETVAFALVGEVERVDERDAVVVDPMLATGNSAIAAVTRLKALNPRSIKFVCLLTCPEGIAAMRAAHPDVPIFTAAIDRQLNDHGYILPGLGDAGDRMFGTK